MSRLSVVCATLFAALYLAASLRPVYSQITNAHPLWTARFDGVGHGDDTARKIASDPAGNVYVAGTVFNGKNDDYETIKYSPTGIKLWAKRFNAISNQRDDLYDMVVDKSGNVYVTGVSRSNITSDDFKTIKYDTNGNMAWSARYDGPIHSYDAGEALTLDSDGNVYVAGVITVSITLNGQMYTKSNSALLKYDGITGALLWERDRDFGSTDVSLYEHVATDAAGNAYAGGVSTDQNDDEFYCVAKYSADGTLQWTSTTPPSYDYATLAGLALDNAGNVYMTGEYATDFYDSAFATAKMDAHGTVQWLKLYAADNTGTRYGTYSYARGLGLDSKGNVYVTGTTTVGAGSDSNGDDDYATLKYAPDGTQVWLRLFNGSDTGRPQDDASGLVVNAKDQIVITGSSYNQGSSVWATVSYDAAGTLLSTRRYRVSAYSYGPQVILDGLVNILLSGTYEVRNAYNQSIADFLTLKYAP